MKMLRLIFSGLAFGLMAVWASSTAKAQARNKCHCNDAPVSVNQVNMKAALLIVDVQNDFVLPGPSCTSRAARRM
jgi:hypothetical protein